MKKIEYFNYQKVAREMKVPLSILKKIEDEVKEEFPKDKMMYELHVLRALRSKFWEKKHQVKSFKVMEQRRP
ncbi:MAG: hypothetical protein A2W19_13010 [Spirochaetes bacterium RBG_16_49_21]|nr:MAG: hypothetical protein A2W19_13010 [Spirochaetes bacterium RBG_16_49_21]